MVISYLNVFGTLVCPDKANSVLIVRKGVSTSVIADRIDAGETVDDLAQDYDLEPGEVEEAVVYERAA